MLDFMRIVCAVPPVKVADVAKNAQDICAYMEKANGENADVVLFPELSLTGYSCGDLPGCAPQSGKAGCQNHCGMFRQAPGADGGVWPACPGECKAV